MDELATEGIDSQFQEINIVDLPLTDNLDVRMTDAYKNNFWNNPATYHTKKQIIDSVCTILSVDIKCKNYPIIAKWDNSILNDVNLSEALITSIPPGGWWDVGSPSDMGRINLKVENSVSFTANIWEDVNDGVNDAYGYINDLGDTLSVFWFTFDPCGIGVGTKGLDGPNSKSRIYPNPSFGVFTVESKMEIESIELYNVNQMHLKSIKNSHFDIAEYPSGIYWVEIRYSNGGIFTQRIIKI